MISIEDIAKFEKFEAGKLGAKENEEFKRNLNEDEIFKANYEKYQHLLSSIKQQQRYKERIQLFNDIFKSKERSSSKVFLTADSTAAGFPILAVLVSALTAIALTLLVVWFVVPSMQTVTETSVAEEAQVAVENVETTENKELETVSDSTITAAVPVAPESLPDASINAFMISQSGYFLTQYSKLKDAKSLRVLGVDSTSRKVELVHYSIDLDLAVLKADKADLKTLGTLVFRLATTQAAAETDIMLAYFSDKIEAITGKVLSPQNVNVSAMYSTDLTFNENCSAAPVISKNGNIIGISIQRGEQFEVLKSTEFAAWLNLSAAQGKLPDYMPTTENRLSGIERADQITRLTPFLNKVLLFY